MYRGRWGGDRSERCLAGVEDLRVSRVPRSRKWFEGTFLSIVEDSILSNWLLLNGRVWRRDRLG
jgi:hypothetical protein